MGALPILLMTFAIPFGGIMADFIRKKGTMSTTNVRKLFNCLGYGIEALVFLMVAQATTAVSASFTHIESFILSFINSFFIAKCCVGFGSWTIFHRFRNVRLLC